MLDKAARKIYTHYSAIKITDCCYLTSISKATKHPKHVNSSSTMEQWTRTLIPCVIMTYRNNEMLRLRLCHLLTT